MRVRCTAAADFRSNAVGALELECTDEGLCIALRGVCRYREGYAPGPPVQHDDVCVPWSGVYATRLGDHQLQLSIDARSLSLNRFILGEFAERPPDADSGWLGWRGLPVASMAAGLVALGICLSLAQALPHARAIGTVGWAALVVAVAIGAIALQAHVGPRRPAPLILDELCHELSRYVPQHIAAAAPTAPPRSREPRALSSLLPRSTVATAITLAAATLAALVGSRALRPGFAPLGAEAGSAGAATARTAAPMLDAGHMPRAFELEAAAAESFP